VIKMPTAVSLPVSLSGRIFVPSISAQFTKPKHKVPNCAICGRFMRREGIVIYQGPHVVFRSTTCNNFICDSNSDGHCSSVFSSLELDDATESPQNHEFVLSSDGTCVICGYSQEWEFHV